MKKTNKKGFTIVELVIVIAVVAILAAVLIPTFVSVTKKANTSADIQACRQMNTHLAINEVTEERNIFEVYKSLKEGGMTAKNYKPLSSDTYYFWDETLNRILYTDKDQKVLYPEEYSSATSANRWYSLTQEIPEKDYTITNNVVEIESAGQLVKLSKTGVNNGLTIKLEKDVDMMGAAFHIDVNADVTLTADKPVTIKGLVNTNLTEAVKNNAGHDTVYQDAVIKIKENKAGINIKIENVTFDGMCLDGEKSSDVALVVLNNGRNNSENSSVTINNVKITNSTFFGKYRIAGFVAHTDCKVTMTDCSIDNSTLTASVGAVAPIFSMLNAKSSFTNVTIGQKVSVVCTNTNTHKFESSLKVGDWEVKLPADGIMVSEPEGSRLRWYPAKSAFGIYGCTIVTSGATADPTGEYPLASSGLDCVETIDAANAYVYKENRS